MTHLNKPRLSLISSHRARLASGFTLIELLIAITLLAVIMSVAYSALAAIVQSKTYLDDGRDADMLANAVIMRLTRELSSIELRPAATGGPLSSIIRCDTTDPAPGQPVALQSIQETLTNGKRGDQIVFIASNVGQYIPDGEVHSGLVQISYRIEDSPEEDAIEGASMLVREELPFPGRSSSRALSAITRRACERILRFPITNRLSSLKFEFYDERNQKWEQSIGTGNNSFTPRLARFSIQLISTLGVLRTYSSSVPIRSEQ
jgi:prepilin-type N-terminal cleavage/methylation domain-containing protein